MRAFLGFIAGAIAVLIFHQGMVAALHALGWLPIAPYSINPVAPFGVPVVGSHCFWGGLYGALFGLLLPRFTLPTWLCGLILGIIAAVVGWFIVAPLKGSPVAGGWMPANMLRSVVINGFWGLGVGIILPLLLRLVATRPTATAGGRADDPHARPAPPRAGFG
jgi:hypothetical protein